MLDRAVTQNNIDDYIHDMGISFTTADSETASMEDALSLFESRQRSRLGLNEIFISGERYPGLGYDESLARLRRCRTPKKYATSTFAVSGPDDEGAKSNPVFATSYAQAYGSTLDNLSQQQFLISQMDTCDSFQGNETGFFKRRLKYISQNGGTSVELCGSAVHNQATIHVIVKDFITTHQGHVDTALQIFLKAHSDLNPDILRSEYYDLIRLEFSLFNSIDLIQDAAAVTYADSPYKDQLRRNFPGDAVIQAGFTDVGVAQALIRAIFDPKKMFAIKALTWDLQLTNLKNSCPNLRASVMTPPFIIDDDFAHDLTVIAGAAHLVQFPEETDGIYEKLLSKRYPKFIIDAYTNSIYFGSIFNIPQVHAYTTPDIASCITDMPSFGYVKDLGTGKTTCFKMRQ